MFIGRKDILEDLESLWRKRNSSLVACRGRRRIGKSTLFREFARRSADVYIEIEGLPPTGEREMTNQDEIDHFMESLDLATGCGVRKCERWLQAFAALDRQIDDGKRTVVLLDEISWMGKYDPLFPSVLWKAWETMFHRHEKLIVVICGSVSSWIQKNILGSTGFAGRLSRNYVMPELSLSECVQFWGSAASRIAPREIFDVLSITGGVPRYLEEIDPGVSADENIRRMCFEKGGELFKDFDSIFSPLLSEGVELKIAVLAALVEGPKSGVELAECLGAGNNGRFAELLRDLKEGGFIDDDIGKNPATGAECRVSKYRLRDNYTRFYLKYVFPRKLEIDRGVFQYASLDQLPEWDTIRGLQFENLIVNNYRGLLPYLHIGDSIIESAAPYRNTRAVRGSKRRGVQIDLLVQTACTAYVIEIKRKKHIGSEIEDELREKIRRLPLREGVSARAVLVYDGELAPVVSGRGYFDAIIPARKLIGL